MVTVVRRVQYNHSHTRTIIAVTVLLIIVENKEYNCIGAADRFLCKLIKKILGSLCFSSTAAGIDKVTTAGIYTGTGTSTYGATSYEWTQSSLLVLVQYKYEY